MGYKISDIYQGGYSSLNPSQNEFFTGYTGDVSKLGVSTDPRTANILSEVNTKLNPGQKIIELSLIDLGTPLDTISKQQMQEVKRLADLTGVEITVHGPIADASGISNRGQLFSEEQREIVKRKLINSIERSHELNPKGNIPVTFHTSNELPGEHWTRDEKTNQIVTEIMPVVNVATGQVAQVKREVRNRPLALNKEKNDFLPVEIEKKYEVEEQLEILNNSEWIKNFEQLIIPQEHANRLIQESLPYYAEISAKEQKAEEEGRKIELDPIEKEMKAKFLNAQEQLRDIQSHVHTFFEHAFKSATKPEEKEYLKEIGNSYNNHFKESGGDPIKQNMAVQEFIHKLRKFEPKLFVPVRDYALEKTADSYGDVALESYRKFGKTAPIINIENPPAGGGLSTGKDLKELVNKTREKFVEKAVLPESQNGLGMSKSQAEKEAEKLIGVTWDVGHINQLRRFGFTGEEIIEEAGKVKELVKHVHLSDNFGMDNIEMPMGMGNVDFKKVMDKLGKNADEAKKIVEAAHWWQFEKSSPIGVSMQALGSPLYSMYAAPAWNQIAGIQGGYFGGYGTTFPQINYETFGAGFSNLPTELGGQRPGARGGRMSGNPME